MEVFGTISTALDLIQRIKDSFTKINRALRGGLTISEKIADSLHGIEDLLRQDALMDSPALRGDLIDFEQGLRRILLRRETLLKKSGDGLLNRSIKRLKEVFHPDDVTNDLYLLCERIQYCLQSLQTKQMKQKGDEEKKCDPLAEALYSLLSENQKVIAQIEDKLADRIAKAELDKKQAQALIGVRRMSMLERIKSYGETKKALQSNKVSSDMETRYLRLKLKTLSEATTWLPEGVGMSSDPGLQKNTNTSACQTGLIHYRIVEDLPKIRADASQELIHLLQFLQSGKQLSDSDAVWHLSGLAIMLDDLSMFEEAEIISAQVVPIARRLASNKEPNGDLLLAVSLDSLAKAKNEVGHCEDALVASEESVKIYRGLIDENPQTFPSGFIISLIGLSVGYHNLGRYEEAIKIAEEAVNTSRRHVNANPRDLIPALGIAIGNMAFMISNVGRHEDALTYSREAKDIFRRLLKNGQKYFSPYLAFYLSASSFTLTKLGQHGEALEASKESVKIYRRLIKYGPIDSYFYQVFPLYTMACCHYKMDQCDKALPMVEESLSQGRHPVNPELDQYNKARFLDLRALCLSNMGRHQEAVEVGKEVLEIVRLLDERRPAVYGQVVSEYLLHQSRALYGKGDNESAKLAVQESIDRYRVLAKDNPVKFNTELKKGLTHLSDVLLAAGNQAEANKIWQEALQL